MGKGVRRVENIFERIFEPQRRGDILELREVEMEKGDEESGRSFETRL